MWVNQKNSMETNDAKLVHFKTYSHLNSVVIIEEMDRDKCQEFI